MSDIRPNSSPKIIATKPQIEEMLNYYEGYLLYSTNPYVIARAKLSDCTITFYKTNTVLFQGEQDAKEYNLWAKKFNLDLNELALDDEQNEYWNKSCIGSDEVGTGDYFGPIVVAATYVSSLMVDELTKLGVKDSKLLTDNQILEIGLKLIKMLPYSVVILKPEKYNSLSDAHSNMNFLKAYLHNKVITSILKKIENVKYDAIIVDEFTPKEKYLEYLKDSPEVCTDITTIKKGERSHLAVAAASIIARVAYLKEFKKMQEEFDFNFLKGASHEVDKCAITFVKNRSFQELSKVAKLKFSNTERIKASIK